MEPNFNTGTGVIKGWRHQVDQGHMVYVYGNLAIVKVEVQFVIGVGFFPKGAQNFHYIFCLSKTDTHKLLIHWNVCKKNSQNHPFMNRYSIYAHDVILWRHEIIKNSKSVVTSQNLSYGSNHKKFEIHSPRR